jgi:hypothetical protein
VLDSLRRSVQRVEDFGGANDVFQVVAVQI